MLVYVWFHVFRLQDAFIQKFSVKRERSDETELTVDFAFLTKQEMAEEHSMTETLDRANIVYMRAACMSMSLITRTNVHTPAAEA